jgi:hypothetical protein
VVISDKYKYLFIEIPRNATWAIHAELSEHYEGTPILHKHATYPEFKHYATSEQLSYFVFAGVRNPLDTIVTSYVRLSSGSDQKIPDSIQDEAINSLESDYILFKRHEYLTTTGADFESYFHKYRKRPFYSMIDLSAENIDFIMRFECLQDDFSQVLEALNIVQLRPLPVVNKTAGKSSDWKSYYTQSTIDQAKRVCAPYAKRWGYECPPEWGEYELSWRNQLEYRLLSVLRRYYLLHFRYNNRSYAKLIRRMRAAFLD